MVKDSPRGRGPYGIWRPRPMARSGTARWPTASWRSSILEERRVAGIVEPPTQKGQGARRVWSDSHGRIWVSEWNSGNVSMHDPRARVAGGLWKTWKLPGDGPRTYAVYVDDKDMVWLSDFSANAVVRFEPADREVRQLEASARQGRASVRQILGRPGETWGGESGNDRLVVIQTVAPA